MKYVISKIGQINRSTLILALLAGNFVIQIILGELIFFIEPEFVTQLDTLGFEFFESMPLISWIFLAVILIPFIETLVFQFILLLIIKKIFYWIAKSDYWAPSLVVTSLVFAFAHSTNFGLNYYGMLNAVLMIVPAFSLTFLAILEFEKRNGHPILSVFVLHGSNNLIWTIFLAISA